MTRRLASPSLEPPLRQRWDPPSTPRPVVFLGAGGIVDSAQLPAYERAGWPVLGVFDVRREASEALAQKFGLERVFGSLDEAVTCQDVVFDVAVPAEAVLGVVERLPHGAPVLIQKPMGRDLAEAERILATCRRGALTAAVNFQLRFSPNMLALRDAIERGVLGTIRDVEVRVNVHTPWHLWDFLRGIPRHEILYHSIHYLDLIRSLLGEPASVFCRVAQNPALPDYSDTSSAMLLDYGARCRCVLSLNHGHAYGPRHMMSELKIEGTRGAAIAKMGVNLDYPRGEPDELCLALEGDRELEGQEAWQRIELTGSWFNEAFEGTMANLQRYVAGEDRVLHTRVADAARTMALVEACYRSATTSGTPLPPIDEDDT